MTQEDKELLLEDLCARLPYGVICHYNCAIRCDTMEINKSNCVGKLEGIIPFNGHIGFMVGGDKVNALFHDIKPYLRSMSSMTEEERNEYYETMDKYTHRIYPNSADFSEHTEYSWTTETFDFLNAHHFDYRGLIPMGLAIEVNDKNNPYKN